jgi:CubicO group peptidase (beta-lactamase class C family)
MIASFRRRPFLLSAGAYLASPAGAQPKARDFATVAPDEAGFAPDMAARLDKLVASKRASNLHGVVVLREGRLVLERYYRGTDETIGKDPAEVVFDAGTLHDLRSVTKSVVGLLYGIALERGLVPPPEARLFDSLPQYADLAKDPGRARLTIHHVLTMTLGNEWDETVTPYTDPANSENRMDSAPDRYRYVLERPLVFAPGGRWVYCSGCTELLGKLIADGTGKALHAFAREALFEPLGIGETEWVKNNGVEHAAGGLRMRPRDLARIGQLMIEAGDGPLGNIVPAAWIKRATAEIAVCDEQRRYGYQWYSGNFGFEVASGPAWNRPRLEHWWGCFGLGGQRLWVLPGIDLVVAITAGNYEAPDQWLPPIRVMREVVLGSIV